MKWGTFFTSMFRLPALGGVPLLSFQLFLARGGDPKLSARQRIA
jgi:hypothetical protein